MQNTLNVIAVQTNIIWENPKVNLISYQEKIDQLNGSIDLIVLPEMFSTGFTMQPNRIAEKMDGHTVQWMQEIAISRQMAIVGSLVIEENHQYYNRALFVHPNGKIEYYDKRHLFTLAGEDKVYVPGENKVIILYKGWRICPLICYDLRFPVWSRYLDNYDLLLYLANWPITRISAWDSLLKARAIENMSYCVGVNRIGEDANGFQYNGHSAAYDFLGERIATSVENEESELRCLFDKSQQDHIRKKLNFLNDKDRFTIY